LWRPAEASRRLYLLTLHQAGFFDAVSSADFTAPKAH